LIKNTDEVAYSGYKEVSQFETLNKNDPLEPALNNY